MKTGKDRCENCKECVNDGEVYICMKWGARTTGDQVCAEYRRDEMPQKMQRVIR